MKRKALKVGERPPATKRSKHFIRYDLHLPPALHEKLSAWAKQEGRSLHAQMLHVLTAGYRDAHPSALAFVEDDPFAGETDG